MKQITEKLCKISSFLVVPEIQCPETECSSYSRMIFVHTSLDISFVKTLEILGFSSSSKADFVEWTLDFTNPRKKKSKAHR